jgi:predicted O-methyltransferase YrrM
MKSVDALPKLIVDNQKFDVIYVDGSHLACDVLFDAVNSFKLLKVGGLMIFDDYLGGNLITSHDVKPAVDAFVFSYSEKVKTIAVAYQYWVQKVSE